MKGTPLKIARLVSLVVFPPGVTFHVLVTV